MLAGQSCFGILNDPALHRRGGRGERVFGVEAKRHLVPLKDGTAADKKRPVLLRWPHNY